MPLTYDKSICSVFIINTYNVWVKKMKQIQKLAINKQSTFFVQSLWNLVKKITSWVNHFHEVSWGWDTKCVYSTIGPFLNLGPFLRLLSPVLFLYLQNFWSPAQPLRLVFPVLFTIHFWQWLLQWKAVLIWYLHSLKSFTVMCFAILCDHHIETTVANIMQPMVVIWL